MCNRLIERDGLDARFPFTPNVSFQFYCVPPDRRRDHWERRKTEHINDGCKPMSQVRASKH